MSQRAATITSLPVAFEVVKAMQADGLDWSEGFRPLGRQAVAEIIEQQMAKAIDVYLDSSRPTTLRIGAMAIIGGIVTSIARGRRWLDEIVTGAVTSMEQIAAREKCSIRQVHMTISLAFLAPNLVQAAVEGRLPRGIGVARLRDAPAEWSRQHAMLGLA